MRDKEKFILSIIITIIGGTIMITSLVFGILKITNGLYEDVFKYPVKLSLKNATETAGRFNAKTDEILSFWLKVPDRRIENQDFKLLVKINDPATNTSTSWKHDFNFGYLRNSSNEGQYYQIGTHRFLKPFNGNIDYISQGSWVPPYNAYLVVRRVKALKLPKIEIILFMIGIIIVLKGAGYIQKNMKCMCE